MPPHTPREPETCSSAELIPTILVTTSWILGDPWLCGYCLRCTIGQAVPVPLVEIDLGILILVRAEGIVSQLSGNSTAAKPWHPV